MGFYVWLLFADLSIISIGNHNIFICLCIIYLYSKVSITELDNKTKRLKCVIEQEDIHVIYVSKDEREHKKCIEVDSNIFNANYKCGITITDSNTNRNTIIATTAIKPLSTNNDTYQL